MKKINNKGFMLIETLIVATFLVTTLLFIYVQFNNITRTYNTSFKYNTVNGLYNANNIKKYISTDGLDALIEKVEQPGVYFVNIAECSSTYFSETEYCNILINSSNVKTALFTKENLSYLKNRKDQFGQSMVDFIDYINYDKTIGYRIIIEFNDNTFATLKI